ncbi:hypothetical protein BK646_14355 [Pseudomonas protegens]|nr:hypothetical protein BK646_14355 [Pseudomonas protegens]
MVKWSYLALNELWLEKTGLLPVYGLILTSRQWIAVMTALTSAERFSWSTWNIYRVEFKK